MMQRYGKRRWTNYMEKQNLTKKGFERLLEIVHKSAFCHGIQIVK